MVVFWFRYEVCSAVKTAESDKTTVRLPTAAVSRPTVHDQRSATATAWTVSDRRLTAINAAAPDAQRSSLA